MPKLDKLAPDSEQRIKNLEQELLALKENFSPKETVASDLVLEMQQQMANLTHQIQDLDFSVNKCSLDFRRWLDDFTLSTV